MNDYKKEKEYLGNNLAKEVLNLDTKMDTKSDPFIRLYGYRYEHGEGKEGYWMCKHGFTIRRLHGCTFNYKFYKV